MEHKPIKINLKFTEGNDNLPNVLEKKIIQLLTCSRIY